MTDNAQHMLALTPEKTVARLAERARTLADASDRRVLVGIVGGPGAGKSTLAAQVVARLNTEMPGAASLLPMDGFHMAHAKLETLGTVNEKGAPHTFEAAAFVQFLETARMARQPISVPGYSRQIEDVVKNATTIPAVAKILVVEGNYLLLATPPWDGVRPQLDLTVFLHVPRETVRARLTIRHAESGLFTPERNREHIERIDLANYDLVEASGERADWRIELITQA